MPTESIYNLVPKEPEPPIKRKVFHAKNPEQILLPGSTFGCHGSTRVVGSGMVKRKDGAYMGPPKPETGLPRPTMKVTGASITNQSQNFTYTDKRKDPVPNRDDRPICGISTKKNFITANAVEAILMGKLFSIYLFIFFWYYSLYLSIKLSFKFLFLFFL